MQQQFDITMMGGSADKARSDRSRSPVGFGANGLPARPKFADDGSRMSSALKSLGMQWSVGKDRCCSKKFRDSLVCSCNCHEWPMIRLSTISDEYTDMILFVSTGIGPVTKPGNFAAESKGEVRDAARSQHAHKMKLAPQRLRDLGEDLDNLPIVAMKLGYHVEWLSPQMKEMWEQVRSRHSAAMCDIPAAAPRRGFGGQRQSMALTDAAAPSTPQTPGTPATPEAARHIHRVEGAEEPMLGFPAAAPVAWSVPALRLPRLPGGRRNAAPIAPADDDDDDDDHGRGGPAAAHAVQQLGGGGQAVARLDLLVGAPHLEDGDDSDGSPRSGAGRHDADNSDDGVDRSVDLD